MFMLGKKERRQLKHDAFIETTTCPPMIFTCLQASRQVVYNSQLEEFINKLLLKCIWSSYMVRNENNMKD